MSRIMGTASGGVNAETRGEEGRITVHSEGADVVIYAAERRSVESVGTTAVLLLMLAAVGSPAAATPAAEPAASPTQPASAAATVPAPPGEGPIRPIDQELCAADWWIAQALREAEHIEDAKQRGSAIWSIGVTAFDAGRLDLVRQVMEMPELDPRDQGTLASRLCSAFEASGDLRRLEELAPRIRDESARDNAYEGIVKLYAVRGELARAEQVVKSMSSHFSRNQAYLWLADVHAKKGDLPAVWALAEKAALGESSSDAPKGFLIYITAAAKAGKTEEVDRAVRTALTIGDHWPDGMRDDLTFDLIDTLRACHQGTKADALAARIGKTRAPSPEREATGRYLEAAELAENGRYVEANRKAEGIGDRLWYAAALVSIARTAAEEKPRSQDAAALRQMIERAKVALREVQRAEPDPAFGRDTVTTARSLAIAQAAAGSPDEALATIHALDRGGSRDAYALLALADQRANAGDVAFVRAAIASEPAGDGKAEVVGRLTMDLATAQVKAGQLGPARATAEQIDSPADRCQALLTVARAFARAGDLPGCNQLLDRARAARNRPATSPGPLRMR
jgi:hypothetical protein